MKKSEKIKIVDELINRATNLTYDVNSHPQFSIINDALSFLRNTLEKKNADVWESRIISPSWGVPKAHSPETESTRFTRWHSARDKFISTLKSIKLEIEQYTADVTESTLSTDNMTNNEPIIFLSHSSTDKSYGDTLEVFITALGVKKEQLIYTAHSLHGIPLDANIFDYLRKNIHRHIFMIFLLSDKYFDSSACLNEMGAAWVTQSDYTNIFIPNFNFKNPKFIECAIDTKKKGIILNGDDRCKSSMLELKNKIISLFGLSLDEMQSSYLLDKFIKELKSIK